MHFPARALATAVRRTHALTGRVCALLGVAVAALGAQPARDPSPHSDVQLVAATASVAPGSQVTVAVRLTLDAGWHTYWTNPGDAGLPLQVTWALPAGVTAGPLLFPTPRLTPQPPLMSYGYEREMLALVRLTLPTDLADGSTLHLAGSARWLTCADVCLPAKGDVTLDLPVTTVGSSRPTPSAVAIARTEAQLPVPLTGWTARAWPAQTTYTVLLTRNAGGTGPAPDAFRSAYLFADTAGVVDAAAPQRIAQRGDTLVLSLPRPTDSPKAMARLSGILTPDSKADDPRAYAFTVALGTAPRALAARAAALLADGTDVGGAGALAATAPAVSVAPPEPVADMSLLAAVAFAFLGGLLLNLMPCVFPVLTVKVLALLEHGGTTNMARARTHALAFGAGVLASFWILAGALFALRAGGEQLGWGFQLQSPIVVALLALVMFALALSLSGVFEIGLSLTRLGGVGAGRGYTDSLLTGALAVVVAAPCTAPFMGAALGYALVQPAFVGLLVFTALGLGLALPFMLLASVPALLRFMPRPGPWLETLRQLFAFPLYATVVWLLWVLGQQAGVDALSLVLLALIVLALGAWLWARGTRSGQSFTRAMAGVTMLAAALVAGIGASRPAPVAAAPVVAGWEPWSAARVAELRAAGRPVFIDFTAAWCLSCQVNERVALRTAAVREAFAGRNVALLRADWTSRDSSITDVLASFGRSGVPLYVLYPADRAAAPVILPAVLTPGLVVQAVTRAAPATVAVRPR